MAKISARGATEVARARTLLKGTKYIDMWVLCSDGRLLRRSTTIQHDGFKVVARIKSRETPLNQETLERILRRSNDRYTILPGRWA